MDQERLIKKFGDGNYLTNSTLDWGDPIVFRPKSQYNPALTAQFANAADPIDVDGILDEEKYNFGQSGRSVWTADQENLEFDDQYDGIFLFGAIIKRAGDPTFRVPRALAPIVPELMRQAEHQFTHSEHAVDKVAGLSLRMLPILKNTKQLAEGTWHIHNPFTRELVEDGYGTFDLTQDQLEAIETVSPKLIQTEYLLSNMCATKFQTQPYDDPVPYKTTHNFRIVLAEPEHRQADDMEVIMGNSYMYHTAASIPSEFVGQKRAFAITAFMPTTEMEQHFENG